jgi:hypothetical protein
MKDIFNPKDKDYLRDLLKTHPHLKEFVANLAKRFPTEESKTMCETFKINGVLGVPCTRMLFPEEINIFITPGPDYKPYVLCRECLQREYQKVAGSGEYDIHLRHIDKDKRDSFK